MLAANQKKQNKFWLTFGLCALAAGCVLLPFWVVDKGIFLYAGDFNTQQIPFSYHIDRFMQQGGGSFDWVTDLGSGFVNSYSFYLLGSPFFWLSSLLPAEVQPYMMVPLLMLKFGTAGGGAYLWLRRWCKDPNYAVLGGALYALSGFNLYNIFFNHFVDVAALFPYLLWALDETVLEHRRGLLPPLVAVNLLVNYFFFAGQVVFLCLYFICMLAAGRYKLTVRLFFQLAMECLLGCGIGCFLAFPALLSLKNNPRTFQFANGTGLLMYSKPHQYFAILASLLFPPDPPYLPAIFGEGIIKWTSLSAYLPAIGFAGALAYLRGRKGTAWRKLLAVCFVFALVPVLNSSFYALNSSFYARWYYMPILILCAATVSALEEPEDLPLAGSVRAVALMALAYAAFALVPTQEKDEWQIGAVQNQGQFWLSLALTLLGLVLFWCVWQGWQGSRRPRALLALVLGFGCLTGLVEISIGKFAQWDGDKRFVQMCYREARQLKLPEEGFYRIDSYGGYDNLALWTEKPCLRTFNSTVAPSILEFYPSVGVKRDVSSKPELEQNALRGLLGVKYMLCDVEKQTEFEEKAPEGWTLADTQGSFAIYENENALPLGFAYRYFLTPEQLENVTKEQRAQLLCKAIVLDEEQQQEYGHLLKPLPQEMRHPGSYADYQQAVAERRAMSVQEFVPDRYGFTASIRLEEENLVLFTVPWDQGFTAQVNGQPAPVLKVSNGLMAVPAPAGESTIRCTYHTPGFGPALAVSGVCLVLYAGYLLWAAAQKRKAGLAQTAQIPQQIPHDPTQEPKE